MRMKCLLNSNLIMEVQRKWDGKYEKSAGNFQFVNNV